MIHVFNCFNDKDIIQELIIGIYAEFRKRNLGKPD